VPITITPSPPTLSAFGPGLITTWVSDFVGPLTQESFWAITVYPVGDETQFAIRYHLPTTVPRGSLRWLQTYPKEFDWGQVNLIGATQYTIHIELNDGTNVIDSGNEQLPYDATSGLGVQHLIDAENAPGFTTTDRADLQQASQQTNQLLGLDTTYTGDTIATVQDVVGHIFDGISVSLQGAAGAVSQTLGQFFSGKTWDLLGLFDFGSVCAPDVFQQEIGGATFFGIQLECTSYADWYVFTGPGDTYTTQSLGTLEITRGGSVILRQGLHTLTHTVYPLPGVPLFEMVTEMPTVPGNYIVTATPAPETCWHVSALQFP